MINGWKEKRVSDCCKIHNGGTPNTSNITYWNGDINWCTPTDITNNNSKYIFSTKKTITDEGVKFTGGILPVDCILLCSRATIGELCINKVPITTNQGFKNLVINQDNDTEFLFYLLKTKKNEMCKLSTGSTFNEISKKSLSDIMLLVPAKKNEQKLIAEYLSDADELIENLERLIDKKKNIKLGTMQELLTGKKRLPGFNKEWEEKSLGELGVFTGGGVDKKLVAGQKPVTLLNFLDVYHKDFIYKRDLHHEVTASDAQIRKCTLKKGDVFFTPSSEMRTDLAMSAVVMENCPGFVYSYHITRFRFNDDFDIKFKSYVFNTKYFLDQASLMCEGSGKRYVINLSKFKNLTIKYPTDIKEQTAIAEIIWDIDQEIQDLEQQLNKYKLLKQGMMEQLLTGKIRLA